MASTIYVAPLLNPDADAVSRIVPTLRRVFALPVVTYRPAFDPRLAFDEQRGQYNSTVLLAELLDELPTEDGKIIGIIDADLFIPVLTFVFGEAQLNGRAAVVSMYRLRDSFYGLPDDRNRLIERLQKEAVHELGHVYNLAHCNNYSCVMHASNGVEEIDLKKVTFCRGCRNGIAGFAAANGGHPND